MQFCGAVRFSDMDGFKLVYIPLPVFYSSRFPVILTI
jgi:hypothetical protein